MRPATQSARRRLYEHAVELIARGYREPLTLYELASELSVSPRQLQRAFAETAATSFAEELRAHRLRAAAALLAGQPQLTVADVALLSGHRSAAHLRRAFRTAHGCSPAAFRDALRRGP